MKTSTAVMLTGFACGVGAGLGAAVAATYWQKEIRAAVQPYVNLPSLTEPPLEPVIDKWTACIENKIGAAFQEAGVDTVYTVAINRTPDDKAIFTVTAFGSGNLPWSEVTGNPRAVKPGASELADFYVEYSLLQPSVAPGKAIIFSQDVTVTFYYAGKQVGHAVAMFAHPTTGQDEIGVALEGQPASRPTRKAAEIAIDLSRRLGRLDSCDNS